MRGMATDIVLTRAGVWACHSDFKCFGFEVAADTRSITIVHGFVPCGRVLGCAWGCAMWTKVRACVGENASMARARCDPHL